MENIRKRGHSRQSESEGERGRVNNRFKVSIMYIDLNDRSERHCAFSNCLQSSRGCAGYEHEIAPYSSRICRTVLWCKSTFQGCVRFHLSLNGS